MDEVTIQLLSVNQISAIKSFFCMYLIRPDVSPAMVAFAAPFVHLEGRFCLLEGQRVYRMSPKIGEKRK
jgi:hypothetical protein